jgi:SAM-dependent methyltransferase
MISLFIVPLRPKDLLFSLYSFILHTPHTVHCPLLFSFCTMDDKFWDSFYDQEICPRDPSSFATSVLPFLPKLGLPILDAGCGNGRDTFFFASRGHTLIGVDHSPHAVEKLNGATAPNTSFLHEDFTHPSTEMNKKTFGAVYSRFTIHSVRAKEASLFVKWVYEHLSKDGFLFIEARSVLDPMCGVGTAVGDEKDAYINTHFRRFLRKDELLKELEGLGFIIEFVDERDGVAALGDDNPVVLRVHARK